MFLAIVYVAGAIGTWLVVQNLYARGLGSMEAAHTSVVFWPYFWTGVAMVVFAMLLNKSDEEEAEIAASWGNVALWIVGILHFLLGA